MNIIDINDFLPRVGGTLFSLFQHAHFCNRLARITTQTLPHDYVLLEEYLYSVVPWPWSTSSPVVDSNARITKKIEALDSVGLKDPWYFAQQ